MSKHETRLDREILVHRFAQPGEMVEWIEPYHAETSVTMRMSFEDVAKMMHAKSRKEKNAFYADDQEAVDEFMVVNWAWTVKEVKTPIGVDGLKLDAFPPTKHEGIQP